MKRIKHIAFIFGCFLCTQCFETSYQRSDHRRAILKAISSEIVLGLYGQFTLLSEELVSSISDFCSSPSEESLQAAQDIWWATRAPWKEAEVVNFGPIKEYPLRLGPYLDSWPLNDEAVEDLIRGETVVDQESFSALGGATRGLSVIEYLLWQGQEDHTSLDLLIDDPRRCEILTYASADLSLNALLLEDAWRTEWIDLVGSSGMMTQAKFADEQEVISEWVNRLAFTVENIRVEKFEKPLGDFSPEDVRPDIIESRFSHRSIEDARDALKGMNKIWHGTGDEVKNGLKYVVNSVSIIEVINERLIRSQAALQTLEGPLAELTTTMPDQLQMTLDALKDLQRAIQVDLTQATQVTIRFNDTDGD